MLWVLLALSIVLVQGDDAPKLPKLDEEFQTYIEVKQGNNVVALKRYYSTKENITSIMEVVKAKENTWICNIGEQSCAHIAGSVCTITTERPLSIFSYSALPEKDNFAWNEVNPENMFQFGTTYNNTFNGTDVIRGIDCNKWTSVLHPSNYILNWYFSNPQIMMPSGNRAVPVRLEITKNDGATSVPITYDFISYESTITDKDVFIQPENIVCATTSIETAPEIPNEFSCSMEILSGDKKATNANYYVDWKDKLLRTDTEEAEAALVSTVYDFTTGVQYAMSADTGDCKVTAITSTNPNVEVDPDHKAKDKSTLIIMAHGAQLFKLNTSNLHYQGKGEFRGIKSSVWAHIEDPTHFIKVYFSESGKFIGYTQFTKQGKAGSGPEATFQRNYVAHVYGFNTIAPGLNYFDIAMCFEKGHKWMHAVITLEVEWEKLVKVDMEKLHGIVRKTVASAIKIQEIRINDIYLTSDGDDDVHVWFTVIDPPDKSVLDKSLVWHQNPYKSAADAVKMLKDIIDDEKLIFNITIEGKEKNINAKDLKTDKKMIDGDPRQTVVEKSGYSSGAMAVLAFCMLAVGAIVGVGIGFYLWKRNRGVPYQVHR